MIPRYNRPKIEKIWSLENKFTIWTEIECLIAEKQAMLGVIPKKAAKEIRNKAKFNVKEIEKIEKENLKNAEKNLELKKNEGQPHVGQTLGKQQKTDQVIASEKIGRNELIKITNGEETKEMKYKKAKSLIETGGWRII